MENRVFNNIKWIIVCRIIQAVIALFVTILSARYLGPSGYGLISYAAALTTFVAPIMYLGIDNILVQEIIHKQDEEGEIIGTSIILSLCSAVLCIIGIVTFTYVANNGDKVTVIVCLLYSILLVFQALDLVQYWFQAKLLSKYASLMTLGAYVIVSIYKIVLLILKKNIHWFAIATAFEYMIISFGLIFIYKRLGGKKLSFSRTIAKHLVNNGKYYIVSSLMVNIFAQTDKVMLKLMINETAVGYYSVAVNCVGLTTFVYTAIISSIRPIILENKGVNDNKYELNMIRLYSIIIYLSLFQSVFMCVFAKPIIMILYGEEYGFSIAILRIFVWYSTFSYLGTVRNIWILAENKYKHLWKINLSGAVMNIVLNFFLINVWGEIGAAIASFFTQIFTNVIIGYILKPIRENNKLMLKGLNPMIMAKLCIKICSQVKLKRIK